MKKFTTPPSATPSPLPQRPDDPFLNSFMKAITKSGMAHTHLMTKVNGVIFYNWRALHFQHSYRNITVVDPRAPVMRQSNARNRNNGGNCMAWFGKMLLLTCFGSVTIFVRNTRHCLISYLFSCFLLFLFFLCLWRSL